MPNSVTISGFDEFIRKIQALPGKVRREVNAEVVFAAKDWENRAKRLAPVDQGRLRGAIHALSVKPMVAEVVANIEYAAFVEWGTKKRVRVPAELSTYAAQFRGGGKGGDAKRAIYDWMRRVGIPEERQWAVFISIVTNGINPHPFFFPPKERVGKQLFKNIQNILDQEL